MNGAPTTSDEEPSWRKQAEAVAATATWYRTRTTRGTINDVYMLRVCPRCGASHTFRSGGVRIAPCRLRVVIKPRRARGTAK